MTEYQTELSHLMLFAQSIGIGFLIGLERERHHNTIAGVRTFTLIALAGSLAGYIGILNQNAGVAITIGALVGAALVVAQFRSTSEEPDTTTIMAGVIAFGLGYGLWLGHPQLPAALAIAITAILYFREQLRSMPKQLTDKDIRSFFQFAAVAFILLPVLPDTTYGPYEVFNPYQVGWLVVLISGISLAGYVALRCLEGKAGLLVIGLFGGLVSTTATTLVYARHSKNIPGFTTAASTIILLSHIVLFVRIGILVAAVEPSMLQPMLYWLLGGGLAGTAYVVWAYQSTASRKKALPELEVRNPAELKTALGFAAGFVLVLMLSSWMNDQFADTGVYLVAFISGLTDLDAITISNLKLVSTQALTPSVAVIAIVIAFIANLIFKFSIVLFVGDQSMRLPVAAGFLTLLIGIGLGISTETLW
ncbi:MgtC/SapB family protein [Microbulbifer magnicolonia]|uniref:MgtC/SapB family protein n=1 Tax=Microbulbifer magnicolonia TaxID=3109744 RepID=UPI002B413213|nr:MgtC/SapB family protein [Microbulbifer sp. GG15]